MAAERLFERAFAKVNLTLHVTGRRADGYHLLDSLVVFADLGDVVSAAGTRPLTIAGPFAEGLDEGPDNLVLRAARLFGTDIPPLRLEKNLPVAAGLGGGSAAAAATLRLLARLQHRPIPVERAIELGADVPVCLTSAPQRMQGIGEVLASVTGVPEFWLVLVNPGIAVKTENIFATLKTRNNAAMDPFEWDGLAGFAGFLRRQRNDLQETAIGIASVVGEVLATLAGQEGCALARMSGSGATCFGLFAGHQEAQTAAGAVSRGQPGWWVKAVMRV